MLGGLPTLAHGLRICIEALLMFRRPETPKHLW
jgi:hypothetical protein